MHSKACHPWWCSMKKNMLCSHQKYCTSSRSGTWSLAMAIQGCLKIFGCIFFKLLTANWNCIDDGDKVQPKECWKYLRNYWASSESNMSWGRRLSLHIACSHPRSPKAIVHAYHTQWQSEHLHPEVPRQRSRTHRRAAGPQEGSSQASNCLLRLIPPTLLTAVG